MIGPAAYRRAPVTLPVAAANGYATAMFRLVICILSLLMAPAAARAQSLVDNPYTRVELISESRAPAAGSRTRLAIVLTPEEGWHSYWKNPGGAGAETRATWTLPRGVTASAIRYPVPKTYRVAGIVNYVFEGETALLVDLDIPAGLAHGTVLPVRLRLDYLVCNPTICVPESASLSLDPGIGDGAPDPASAARIAAAEAALPKPVDWPARFEVRDGTLRLAVRTAGAADVTGAYFFPEADGVLDYDAPQQVRRDGDTLILTTTSAGKPATAIDGVLKLTTAAGSMGAAIRATPGTVDLAGTPLAGAGTPPLSALVALPFAILGGLLLNVMPCVFPILGLKAISLARAGGTEHQARTEALAYTGGVMLACLALGGAILGLRAAGEAVGWAFQLQDPRVIVTLLLLVTAIALNLAGLFEIGAPRVGGEARAAQGGTAGAFWTGALAAVVATPCTGPFMGIALGAAILLPAATGLAIFAGLGLGIALPFLAIGFVPALRRRLPKPGPWLATFRRLMAVPMFATALALAWVLGRQSGTAGMTHGIAAALLLSLALWWLGIRQHSGRGIAAPLAIAITSLGAIPSLPAHVKDAAGVADNAVLPATEAFSEARLAELSAAGTPVFVYFTADWCITCKVNENGALSSPEVARAFADAGVVTLVGDWTSADPTITRFLERHGRSGVPLYLFYGKGDPVTLPQLLDVNTLMTLARDAAR